MSIKPLFYKNVSKTDDIRNVYMAGATLGINYKNDILLQKFDKYGDLLWQHTFNGAADMDDMASDVFIDDQYNVYVTGTSTNNVSNGMDLVILKYNSSGTFIWSYYYNGSASLQDIGTAITGDNNGNIYVTGTTLNSSTMADYVTIRIDATNGTADWIDLYDYTQLNDVPSKIEIVSGSLYVTGGSQTQLSPEKWELATLKYDVSNGNVLQVGRSSNSTNGLYLIKFSTGESTISKKFIKR